LYEDWDENKKTWTFGDGFKITAWCRIGLDI